MLALVAMALAAAPAQEAEPWLMRTGNDVLETCSAKGTDSLIVCVAHIQGVVAGVEVQRALVERKGRPTCGFEVPAGVSGEQMRDVVVKYLRDHPEERHLPGGLMIFMALRGAFPCPKVTARP
jgi:hypothetical protein